MKGISVHDGNIEKQYFTKVSGVARDVLKQLGEPEINYFTYWRTFVDQSRSAITTHPDYSVLFFKSGLYKQVISAPFDAYQSGIVFFSDLIQSGQDVDFLVEMRRSCMEYSGFSPDMLWIDKREFYTDFYLFGSKGSLIKSISFYLNRLDSIQKFVRDFQSSCQSVLQKLYDSPLVYPGQQGDLGGVLSGEYHINLSLTERYPGLLNQESDDLLKTFKLTLKEFDVAVRLIDGYGQKEISVLMNISPRTVEKHVASLKRKMGCRSVIHLVSVLSKVGVVNGWG